MKKYTLYILIGCLLGISTQLHAQKDDEEGTLNSETVTIVKPYSPSVSDAFKVKSVPQVTDTTKLKKRPVTYSIFSVPVASTFTPAKGKISKLKTKKRPKYFDNYAKLGLGNYTNILAEFSGNVEVSRTDDFGVFFNHASSQGGIKEVRLDDKFYDTALDLSYGSRGRDMNWSVALGGQHRLINWYGTDRVRYALIDEGTDVKQSYLGYGVSGKLEFFDSAVEDITMNLGGFSSDYDASEFRFSLLPQFAFEVEDEEIGLGAEIDYLSGSFDALTLVPVATDYSYLNFGVYPSINLYGDNYKAELGARVNYLSDLENSDGKINFYPAIDASYIISDETLIAYTAIGGGLDMSSYQDHVNQNAYVGPAIAIIPTNRQIDFELGIKGTLFSKLGYKVAGGYKNEKNKSFYIKGGDALVPATANAYEYRNVFYTDYGDLNTVHFGGSLSAEINSDFRLSMTGDYYSYSVNDGGTFDNIASQLPNFTADLTGEYQITEKFRAGMIFYMVGEREVYRRDQGSAVADSFFDLNLEANYKINNHITAFLNANNLTGGNYDYFYDYPVQGVQIMGGAVYKFNF